MNSIYKILFYLIIILLPFNALKVNSIRLLELVLVISLFFQIINFFSIKNNYLHKYLLLLMFTPFSLFFLSFLNIGQPIFLDLDLNLYSFINKPIPLIISRFIQLTLCISFVTLFLKIVKNLNELIIKINNIIKIISSICVLFIISYFLEEFGLYDSPFVYSYNNRLKGGMIEGGPLGLFLSSIVLLIFFLKNFRIKNNYSLIIILFTIGLTQSKAGMLSLLIIFTLYFFSHVYNKIGIKFKIISLPPFVFFFTMVSIYLYNKLYMYVDYFININTYLQAGAWSTGRGTAFYILPKIFYDNLLFGVGLGHYSLVRNNPDYRTFIPYVEGWDKSGLGFFDIFAENGLIGVAIVLFMYLYFIFKFYKIKIKNIKIDYWFALFPLIFQFLGVQIYFLYHWVIFSIVIYLANKEKSLSTSF
jgi:hypothetical protein